MINDVKKCKFSIYGLAGACVAKLLSVYILQQTMFVQCLVQFYFM